MLRYVVGFVVPLSYSSEYAGFVSFLLNFHERDSVLVMLKILAFFVKSKYLLHIEGANVSYEKENTFTEENRFEIKYMFNKFIPFEISKIFWMFDVRNYRQQFIHISDNFPSMILVHYNLKLQSCYFAVIFWNELHRIRGPFRFPRY